MSAGTENPLLAELPGDIAVQYYQALIGSLGHGIEVQQDAGGGRGKGVFTTKDYAEGDVILTERPLAAVQQMDSKVEVSTCCHCFRAVGTVEEHVGGKICCLINELSEATEDELQDVQDRVDKIHAAVDSRFLEGLLSGAVKLPLTDKVDMAPPVPCRAGCGDEYCLAACEAQAWEGYHCMLCTVGIDSTAASRSDPKGKGKAAAAPHQHTCSKSHSCSSSSGASSSKKAKAVIHQVHGATINRSALADFVEHADESNDIFWVAAQVIASTIITADNILKQQAADAAENAEAEAAFQQAVAAAGGASGSAGSTPVQIPKQQQRQQQGLGDGVGLSDDLEAQTAYELAVAAAAKAGALTAAKVLLPGEKLQAQQQQQQQGVSSQPSAAQQPAGSGSKPSPQQQQQQWLQALQTAFLPFALGHKAPWWDIPLFDLQDQQPGSQEHTMEHNSQRNKANDSHASDSDDIDAAELSAQMRELAQESLGLLKKAIKDDRFPQLFDLQLYGSLVGMFELNNLALAVPAPVARYKDMLLHPEHAGVNAADAAAALAEVTPLLEALGDAADTPAEGTGFYAVQSCVNHSCAPNAAADCLANGQMAIRALTQIPAGSEVLLSYIEEEGADLHERREMLRDYGFLCKCERCSAEELAERLQKQQLQAA